jgi:hypothetical protein
MAVEQRIKYQADLDPRFASEISARPGGENLFSCIQCGAKEGE